MTEEKVITAFNNNFMSKSLGKVDTSIAIEIEDDNAKIQTTNGIPVEILFTDEQITGIILKN